MSAPPPVLLACLSKSWGGQEMHVLATAEALRDAGVAVHLAVRRGTPLARRSDAAGFPTLTYRPPFDRITYPFRARAYMSRHGIRVLHAHGLRGLGRAGVLAPPEVALVMTEHAARPAQTWSPLERGVLGRCARVVLVSPALAEQNMPALGVDPARAVVLPLGVSTERFSPEARAAARDAARGALDLGPGEVAVTLVGRVGENKGQLRMVEAFARVAAEHPEAVLVLAGEFDDVLPRAVAYRDEVRRRIDALGLAPRVRLPGFIEDPLTLHAATDVLVAPSQTESFGLAVLEAMACGLPVLVADRGALPWLVDDGEAGFVVDDLEPATWAEALGFVLVNPETRERLSAAAAASVRARFDPTRRTERLLGLYREALDEVEAAP